MGVQNVMGQLAYLVSPLFLWIMQNETLFTDVVDGAAGLAIAIGCFVVAVGVLPAIILRERYAQPAESGGGGRSAPLFWTSSRASRRRCGSRPS